MPEVTTIPANRNDGSVGRSGAYDIIADEYYQARHITSRNFDASTQAYFVDHQLVFPRDGLALDVGAGKGRLAEYCGIAPTRIVQVDLAWKMLTLNDRETALCRVVGDALALPFREGAFSIVAAFLFDPFNHKPFFEQVARVLSPGGMFIGTLPHSRWGAALRSQAGQSLDEAIFVLNSGQRIKRRSILSTPDQFAPNLNEVGQHVVQNEALTLPRDVKAISPDIEMPARTIGVSVYEIPIVNLVIATKL
jgi:SAM-dependent methyltransferase